MNSNNQIYVISDSHFGHENMVNWSLREKGFEEKIWKGLHALPSNTILIHLGDLTMSSDYEVSQQMITIPYKKWLIRGNHDKHSISWYINNGWDCVCDEMIIDMFGNRILLSHIPQPKREGVTRNIHGHLHGGRSHGRPDFYDETYHFEICPEVVGYLPVKLGSIEL